MCAVSQSMEQIGVTIEILNEAACKKKKSLVIRKIRPEDSQKEWKQSNDLSAR